MFQFQLLSLSKKAVVVGFTTILVSVFIATKCSNPAHVEEYYIYIYNTM